MSSMFEPHCVHCGAEKARGRDEQDRPVCAGGCTTFLEWFGTTDAGYEESILDHEQAAKEGPSPEELGLLDEHGAYTAKTFELIDRATKRYDAMTPAEREREAWAQHEMLVDRGLVDPLD